MNDKLFEAISQSKNTLAQSMCEQIQTDIQTLKNKDNSTVLHIAANNRNDVMLLFFLNMYDSLILKNPTKFTQQNKKKWIDQKDNDGFSALHYSVFQNSKKMALLLEKHGADIHSANERGLNVLHIAAQTDSVALLYYYLEKGLDINSKDKKGSTPLHWACYSGQQITTSALLAWRSQINCQQTEYGMTPLHLAVLSANGRVVKKLLIKGANRSICDKTGSLPLDLAKQNRYQNITEMLIDQQGLQQFLNLKSPFRKTGRVTASFIFFITNFLLIVVMNASLLFPPDSNLNTAFLVLGLISFICLSSLVYRNPGHLKNHVKSNMGQILKEVSPQRICFDCQIVKPQRSKHCQICKSCILVYDHHCPWVTNCIGARNYCLFYVFLLIMIICLTLIIIFELKILFYILQQQNEKTLEFNFIQWTVAIYSCLISMAFLIPLIVLIVMHTKNCLSQKTTHQYFNRKPEIITDAFNYQDTLSQPFFYQSQMQRSSQMNQNLNSEKQVSFYIEIEPQKQISEKSQLFFFKWLQSCKRMCFLNMRNQIYWGSTVQF